jgi:glutathione synthase/RimK-type ligase-like ATP-grasp enzyme
MATGTKTKVVTKNYLLIKSRHPSHNVIRGKILVPKGYKAIFRLGSTTPINVNLKGKQLIEINSTDSIRNSASKLLMKQCFTRAGVKTADWFTYYGSPNGGQLFLINGQPTKDNMGTQIKDLPFPIVAKSHHGSRNEGNTKLNSLEQFEAWKKGKNLNNYIFEKFYNYNKEYRLHVTRDGCFYAIRKMLKSDTPENSRWFRNDSNCVWVLETNPQFNRPSNWDDVVAECVKALISVGLDVGAIDLRIQSSEKDKKKKDKAPNFIILETNSAPSFGEITAEKYTTELENIINNKIKILCVE